MRSLLCSHYSGNRYGYKSGTSKDSERSEISTSIATSMATMTQLDNCAAVLQSMIANQDGLIDRFFVWSPRPAFYFDDDVGRYYERITLNPEAHHRNLTPLVQQIFHIHKQNPESCQSHHLYTFTPDAHELLKEVREEAMGRNYYVENGHWPPARQTEKGHLPESIVGRGHSRVAENLIRLSTVHHVVMCALRCLKNNVRELLVPTLIEVDSVRQALHLLVTVSLAKAVVLEAYCEANGEEVVSLTANEGGPEAQSVNIPTAPRARQRTGKVAEIARKVLLLPGRVQRAREELRTFARAKQGRINLDCVLAELQMHGIVRFETIQKKKVVIKSHINAFDAKILPEYGVSRELYLTRYHQDSPSGMDINDEGLVDSDVELVQSSSYTNRAKESERKSTAVPNPPQQGTSQEARGNSKASAPVASTSTGLTHRPSSTANDTDIPPSGAVSLARRKLSLKSRKRMIGHDPIEATKAKLPQVITVTTPLASMLAHVQLLPTNISSRAVQAYDFLSDSDLTHGKSGNLSK